MQLIDQHNEAKNETKTKQEKLKPIFNPDVQLFDTSLATTNKLTVGRELVQDLGYTWVKRENFEKQAEVNTRNQNRSSSSYQKLEGIIVGQNFLQLGLSER